MQRRRGEIVPNRFALLLMVGSHMILNSLLQGFSTKREGGMKRVFVAAFVVGNFAFAGSALSQGVDVTLGVGLPLAPGKQDTSPGQVFNTLRATNPDALSPG